MLCNLHFEHTNIIIIKCKIDQNMTALCVAVTLNYFECQHLHLLLTYLVAVFPVPLVKQMHVVAHLHQRLPQQLQLGRVDLRWYWTIAVP